MAAPWDPHQPPAQVQPHVRLRPWHPPGQPPRLVAALAGPGYGKSQALVALVAQDEGARVRWVQARAHQAEAAGVLGAVVQAFQAWGPDLGQASLALASQGEDAPTLARALGAELQAAGLGRFWLVVDDAHHWGEVGGAFLAALAEALPPHSSLAFASRGKAPFNLVPWRAKGQALLWGPAELALSPEEQAEWWRQVRPEGPPPAEWAPAAAAMEGWPMGLALLAQHGSQMGSAWAQGDEAELMAALTEAYLEALPEAWATAMLQAALPESFDAELLGEVFGLSEATAMLAQLRASHLVVSEGGQPPQHRYLSAVRLGLKQRALEAFSSGQLRAWHAQLAQRLAYQQPEQAMEHALAAEAPEEALAIAQHAFPEWWAMGRTQAIAACLDRLPQAVAATHPLALLWRGRLAERLGQSDEAMACYRRSGEGAERLGDEAARFAAAVRCASLAAACLDEGAFREALGQAMEGLDSARQGDRCDLLLAQAQMADRHGSLRAASAYNEEVLTIPVGDEQDVAHAQGVALQNLTAYALNSGHLADAQSWLNHWQAHLDRHRLGAMAPTLALYRGILALNRGESPGVGLALQSLPEAWPQTMAWQEAAMAHELAALHALHRKAWPEAHDQVAAARRLHERAGNAAGLRGLMEVAIKVAARQGLWAEARRRFESLGELDLHDLYDQQALLAWCAALVASGQGQEAEAWLQRLLPLLGAELKLAQAKALSLLAAATGQLAPLQEALPLLQDGGLGHLLVEDEGLWAQWQPLLRRLPEASALLAQLEGSWPTAPSPAIAPETSPPADGPAPSPAKAAGPRSAWAAQDQLSARLFGDFELRQGERVLGPWPRRKAKALLAMLVLYPRGLNRVDLAAALFGEEGKAEQSLRTTNSALRSILEPDLPARAPSRYLLIQDERYLLAPEALAYADVQEWEGLLREAEKARQQGHLEEAAAAILSLAQLHRGPLLDEPQLLAPFESERQRFRSQSQNQLRWLAQRRVERGEHSGALPLWQQLVALDPLDEADVQGLMQVRLAQGAPDLARFAYWDHRKALQSSLGVKPSEAMEAAYRKLLGA